MPVPTDLWHANRDELLALDDALLSDLISAYRRLTVGFSTDLYSLLDQIEQAQASGETVNEAWLYRANRLGTFRDQAETRISQFMALALDRTNQNQTTALSMGQDHADREIFASEPALAASFSRLPKPAIEGLVGFLQDGSPLKDTFERYGKDGAQGIAQALLVGIARGQAISKIAEAVTKASAQPLQWSLLVARTETLRAYRTGHLETMRRYPDVVVSYQWAANIDRRCCAFCLSRNGKIFPLEEIFPAHASCRCTPIAVTVSGPQQIEDGQSWLERQDDAVAEAVLGKEGARRWRNKELELDDFAKVVDRGVWGPQGATRSLEDALAFAKQRRARS